MLSGSSPALPGGPVGGRDRAIGGLHKCVSLLVPDPSVKCARPGRPLVTLGHEPIRCRAASGDEHHLAHHPSGGEVVEGGRHLVQRVGGGRGRMEAVRRPPRSAAGPAGRSGRGRGAMAQAPQSTPTTERFRSRTWLRGRRGMVPEAKPITRKRPRSPRARRAVLGQVAADRVDGHVHPGGRRPRRRQLAGQLAGPVLDRLGRWCRSPRRHPWPVAAARFSGWRRRRWPPPPWPGPRRCRPGRPRRRRPAPARSRRPRWRPDPAGRTGRWRSSG